MEGEQGATEAAPAQAQQQGGGPPGRPKQGANAKAGTKLQRQELMLNRLANAPVHIKQSKSQESIDFYNAMQAKANVKKALCEERTALEEKYDVYEERMTKVRANGTTPPRHVLQGMKRVEEDLERVEEHMRQLASPRGEGTASGSSGGSSRGGGSSEGGSHGGGARRWDEEEVEEGEGEEEGEDVLHRNGWPAAVDHNSGTC